MKEKKNNTLKRELRATIVLVCCAVLCYACLIGGIAFLSHKIDSLTKSMKPFHDLQNYLFKTYVQKYMESIFPSATKFSFPYDGIINVSRQFITEKIFSQIDYSTLINKDFLNTFNAKYGFTPYPDFLDKFSIFELVKNFDVQKQSDFFDLYCDFYKNSLTPEILKYQEDFKKCVEMSNAANSHTTLHNNQLLFGAALAVLCLCTLASLIVSAVKRDVSVSFIIGRIGVTDGFQMCCETNKKKSIGIK